jgi:glycosyltransferase involved in cell wall biosynthesis
VKVAYFSPLPPEPSGVADYSAHLLPALERRIEIKVARRGRRRHPRGCDLALYHIGNNAEAHDWIVEALHRSPGLVVLHDVVLHHLVAGMTLGRGDSGGYLEAMQLEGGTVGRLLAHGVIDGLLPPLWTERPEEFPLTMAVVGPATGVVVHSQYALDRLRELGYEGRIWRIPHPSWPVAIPDRSPTREVVIGCFGHLNPAKRIPQLLEAFAALRRSVPGARLVLAGSSSSAVDVDGMIGRLALDGITRHEYVDEPELWRLIAGSDILVNLRSPTMGETSGMVVRALSLGKPLVVSDVGWFAELPDEVAAKVTVDEHEVETLEAVLGRLASDDALRSEMSAAAAEYARTEHDLERVADLYVAAIEEAAGMDDVEEVVLRDVARAAAETGLDSEAPGLGELGDRLRGAGLGRRRPRSP